jgi:glycosyltransferase involved in cell wall biosynthesis
MPLAHADGTIATHAREANSEAAMLRAAILGPHPGNGTFSISNYFSFCHSHLGPAMPEIVIRAIAPGDRKEFDRPVLRESSRLTSWRQNYLEWPLELHGLNSDLFHIIDQGLAWYATFLRGGRRLITVHDLITYLNWTGKLGFEKLSGGRIWLLKRCLAEIHKADHLVSVSEHTADCMVRELGIPASRITVVHNFLSPGFSPSSPEERREARQHFFSGHEHVVLHVGKALAYKNRLGALRSFALLRKRIPDAVMYLTSDPPSTEELAFLGEAKCTGAVHFLSALSQADLRLVYGAADVFIFPSRYEGFGWPPLEAMACGCPVVSTTCASLAEVVGDAALTVPDPDDHETLALHLEVILKNSGLRRELRARGFERAKVFRPERMVGEMAAVYRSLLSDCR